MKKSRVLTAAVVAAMVSLGAGYAAWTDALTINNTVSTGTLDVDFVGTESVSFANNVSNNNAVATGTASGSENNATITLNNLYPGAVATVTIPVKNNGTIPVKNGNFNFTGQPDWLNVTVTQQQPNLNVNEQQNVTITMTVKDQTPDIVPQDLQNVTFTGTATYQQFNK